MVTTTVAARAMTVGCLHQRSTAAKARTSATTPT